MDSELKEFEVYAKEYSYISCHRVNVVGNTTTIAIQVLKESHSLGHLSIKRLQLGIASYCILL